MQTSISLTANGSTFDITTARTSFGELAAQENFETLVPWFDLSGELNLAENLASAAFDAIATEPNLGLPNELNNLPVGPLFVEFTSFLFIPPANTVIASAFTYTEDELVNPAVFIDKVYDYAIVDLDAPGEPRESANLEGFYSFDQFIRAAQLVDNAIIPFQPVEYSGISASALFDESYYLTTNPDVAAGKVTGALSTGYDHFIQFGVLEGRNPSILYEESFYLNANPDVAAAVTAGTFTGGLIHFLQFGHLEGRNPSALFDQSDYLLNNPDVAMAVDAGGIRSGFEHYLEAGAAEGRLPQLKLFEEAYYLQQNPDVAAAIIDGIFIDGFMHYQLFGQSEGRDPSRLFDESRYLEANPDVAVAVTQGIFQSGFEHYIEFGRIEGRV